MALRRRLASLGYALLYPRTVGWLLAAALALLGLQRLGWHRLTHATNVALQAVARATRLVTRPGWPLLLAAATLELGLLLSSPRSRARAARRLGAAPAVRVARWVLAVVGVLTVVLVVAVLPPRFTAHRHFTATAEELKAQNDVRTTLLQALAGALLATGAYLTWRQLRVTREGQITDRYTKAVDQLGSEHLDVRVGGSYALERIARDSPPDRATIEEVLTAFVRAHAPWPPPPAPAPENAIRQPASPAAQLLPDWRPVAGTNPVGHPDATAPAPQRPAADVLAAVTVLGRRQLPPTVFSGSTSPRVDLRGAWLYGANLQGARADKATRWPAGWTRAQAEARGVRYPN